MSSTPALTPFVMKRPELVEIDDVILEPRQLVVDEVVRKRTGWSFLGYPPGRTSGNRLSVNGASDADYVMVAPTADLLRLVLLRLDLALGADRVARSQDGREEAGHWKCGDAFLEVEVDGQVVTLEIVTPPPAEPAPGDG